MRLQFVAVALLLMASGGAAAADHGDVGNAARGSELLKPFKQNLQQALKAGLAQGPDNAIDVCKDEAPAIAARLSTDGVVVGRSSHKLRNPANEPPAWVTPVLARYLEEHPNLAPAVVPLPDDRVGYVEPIVLQPLCLACHGDVLAPDIAARIEAAYPDDAATGFEAGDLRGVFWVEFPGD